ncbi:amino acid adenylation domain-containing protein [Amycolatopsis mediterranei]|uniref:amino acid adenylation domain-containing protein n=1 Tax=Amycolatopsis mediterranei TaxID=33910 RepID=UPI003427C47D
MSVDHRNQDLRQELLRTMRAARRGGDRAGPASAGQRAIWLAHQLDPASPAYHIPLAIVWTGRVDSDRLGRCLTEIVRRHEVLRTGFALRDGQLRQQVLDPPVIRVPVTEVPPGTDPAEARRRSARAPFDLTTGPMLRAEVVRVDGEPDDVVVLTTHHIASDGWSTGILVRELMALHAGKALPGPPGQYLDHARREHRAAADGTFAADLAHWRRVLADAGPATLPADRERGPGARPAGRIARVDLDPELVAGLRALAAREGVTLFMTALAAFAVLLGRHTGEEDVLIGTATSGRDHTGTAELIGFFVNTVVLRIDLRGRPDFPELLARVRAVCASAYDHQRVPFDLVVEHVRPDRPPGGSPFHRAFFTHQSASLFDEDGLGMRTVGVDLGVAGLDFAITLDDAGAAPHLIVEYATDLFEDTTVTRLVEHYRALLHAAVTEPRTPVHAVPLGAGPTAPPVSVATPVPELFARRVAATPHAVAVVDGAVETTFAQLAARAGRLARHLAGRGLGPEDVVAICLPRGTDLMVALLGVLTSGAAYLPLDPAYPPERLRLMVTDAAARALVTAPGLAPELPVPVVVDLPAVTATDHPGGRAPVIRPDSLAYVVYTSGSTGRPRGVMVSHRALASFCVAAVDRFGLTGTDRFLQFASIGFDVAVEEIWPTWLSGGAVVLLPDGPLLPCAEFTTLLARRHVSVTELPTAYWHEWTAELARGAAALPSSLRLVVVGGERVLPDRLETWQRTGVDLAHVYGLTETTVTSTVHGPGPIASVPAHRANLPVGTPLACAEVLVLDRGMNPVPSGVAGEVYLGGPTVGRGYAGRPALTADRFVPHPDPRSPGARLYRTGDRARFDDDGVLVFLGRTDEQVKIRGFRVEPAEVAGVLSAHPLVRDAVVVAAEAEPGRRRLAGYVVPAGSARPEPADLIAFQRARLPEHMVATVLVVLDELPVTPHGKIDKARLPAPRAAAASAVPATEDQRLLATVFAKVLGHDRFGVDDDFFQLGGDSIAAIRLVAYAAEAGLRVAPRDVFERPTVAGLAEIATPVTGAAAEQGPVTGSAPLTPIQRWLLRRDDLHHGEFLVPIELAVAPEVTPDTVRSALAALLRHHDALRTRFAPGRQHVPGVQDEVPLTVAASDADWAGLVATTAATVDPFAGRVVAALLAVAGGGPSRLFLAVHHLVLDAVSLRILLEDLTTAVTACHAGREPVLPPKSASFLAWADACAGVVTDASEVDFWRAVAGSPATALPRDTADGRNTAASAVTLDTHRPAVPHDLVPAQTLDVLLAALAGTLTAWAGGDVLVELEGHGRADLGLDVSRTVGWFTCAYPFRLPGGGTELARLRGVREGLRRVPRGGIGYGLLREGTAAVPDTSPEVAVNFLGRWDGGEDGAGALVRPGPETWRPTRGGRPHLLEVNAVEVRGRLRISWTYSGTVHRAATVEALAADVLRRMDAIVEALGAGADVLVPADFPLSGVTAAQLASLGAGVENVLPPTAAQAAALRLVAAVPEPAAHVMHSAHLLDPGTDGARLRAAWDAVVARRSVLRSGFRHGHQVVYRGVRTHWSTMDLTDRSWADLPDAARFALLESVFDEHEELAHDVGEPGLMRVRVLRLADRPVLVWSYHHLLLDGWSDGIVLGEVAAAYRDGAAARSGSDAGERESFARAVPVPPPAGSAGASGPRGWHRTVLDPAAVAGIAAAARRCGVTTGTVLHSAWALVVGKRLGVTEVPLGVAVTGRAVPVRGVEGMVGPFAKTVPAHIPLPGGEEPGDWLAAVQQALTLAQDGPPLLPGPAPGNPLAHTVFAYENFPTADGAVEGGPPGLTHLHSRQERLWPLLVMAIPDGGGLAVVTTFDTDRVAAPLVRDLVEDYVATLGRVPATGEEPT